MMKRNLSKILAVILTFAMVLCPVLTAMAEGEEVAPVYTGTAAFGETINDGAVTVELTFDGDNARAVELWFVFDAGVAYNAEADVDFGDDTEFFNIYTEYVEDSKTLKVIGLNSEDASETSSLAVNVPVTITNENNYKIELTKIFAVGDGTADAESIFAFENTDTATGDVTVAGAYVFGNVCEHAETEEEIINDATCTAAGSKNIVCSACGEIVEAGIVIDAIGHSYSYTDNEDGTHTADCDNCDATLVEDHSFDENGECDKCFASEVPPVEECTHANTNEVVVTEATCGTAGSKNIVCADCGEIVEEGVEIPATGAHTYDDGVVTTKPTNTVEGVKTFTCSVCGGTKTEAIPVVVSQPDAGLTFRIKGAGIQDSLSIGYTVANSAFAKYDHIAIEVVAEKYDTDRNIYTTAPISLELAPVGTTFTRGVFAGIAMYELNLEVTATIKAYDADGVEVAHSAVPATDTMVSLLTDVYNKTTATATKTLITDMFNLGTVAQTYFVNGKAADCDLALADRINAGWDQTYATTGELTGLNLVKNQVWADNAPIDSSKIVVTPSLNLAATPTVSFLINNKGKYAAADLRLEVSYEAVFPAAYAGTRSDTVVGDDWTVVSSGAYLQYAFTGMTLADSNRVVTAKLYYKDQLVVTTEYTMDQGINDRLGVAATRDIATALARFEAAARAHFSL